MAHGQGERWRKTHFSMKFVSNDLRRSSQFTGIRMAQRFFFSFRFETRIIIVLHRDETPTEVIYANENEKYLVCIRI